MTLSSFERSAGLAADFAPSSSRSGETARESDPSVVSRVIIDNRRGRDSNYWLPPAQTRTCGTTAYGSHLGSDV